MKLTKAVNDEDQIIYFSFYFQFSFIHLFLSHSNCRNVVINTFPNITDHKSSLVDIDEFLS